MKFIGNKMPLSLKVSGIYLNKKILPQHSQIFFQRDHTGNKFFGCIESDRLKSFLYRQEEIYSRRSQWHPREVL